MFPVSYKIKVIYTGARDLEPTSQITDFAMYIPQTDNKDNLLTTYNGNYEPNPLGLNIKSGDYIKSVF